MPPKRTYALTIVAYFELGANNEGYWTYNHMAIQWQVRVQLYDGGYSPIDILQGLRY
jgi:hypothetical protein